MKIRMHPIKGRILLCVFLSLLVSALTVVSGPAPSSKPEIVRVSDLDNEITKFLDAEFTAHLSNIKSYDPQPDKVLGLGASGEYTWGTFVRSVGAFSELTGKRELAGRDLAREVAEIGLLEHRLGGTRFSQLYAVLALRHFGKDLDTNAVWQSMNEDERAKWRQLLDISAFYDPKTREVIKLPENYLGVAARIATVSFELGLLKDRELLDGVVTRAARPFANGGLYADDNPPTGRFDRYSNEYARFIFFAAEAAGRKDIIDAVRPSLKEQMRLWWDLVLPDGYGYAWGRSLGVVSYEDTMEIVAFLAKYPEFRPAPLEQLAAAYYQAWRSLRRDYNDNTHSLSIFAFGRGNYSYITKEREWQQTTGFLGKAALSEIQFRSALKRENIEEFDSRIIRKDVSRFEFFRRGERPAGVWIVRGGGLSFTLPITTGTKPGVSDYLPAPYGLGGFEAPVEQVYPSLAPFIELADGRVIAAADGADEIEPSADGRSVRAVWKRWARIGGKSGELVDPRITSEVVWRIDGSTLTREEKLTSSEGISIRRWWVSVPTIAGNSDTSIVDCRRIDSFATAGGKLAVSAAADWNYNVSLFATGDSSLGRGARRPIPLHIIYETRDLKLEANKPRSWRLALNVSGEQK